MIDIPFSHLKAGVVPLLAWQQARQSYRRGRPLAEGDGLVFLRAAGMLQEDGSLSPDWEEPLGTAVTSTSGLVLVASHGTTVFLSNVYLSSETTVIARSRAVAQAGRVTRMEPTAEIISTEAAHTWEALVRVLPPGFDSAPRRSSRTPMPHGKLPPGVQTLADIASWDGAPEELRQSVQAALEPDSIVTVAWGSGQAHGSLLWYRKDGDLFRVSAEHWDRLDEGAMSDELVEIAQHLRA